MSAPSINAPSINAPLRAILLAGLAAAVAEMVLVLPIQQALGNSAERVFQVIDAFVVGRAALAGGLQSALAGGLIHFLVSLAAAAVFIDAAAFAPVLIRRWLVSGLMFGVVAYGVMTWLVIPLSALPNVPGDPVLIALSLFIHMAVFGLPIAAVARWSARTAR
jgi:hypothetical protein